MKAGEIVKQLSKVHPDTKVLLRTENFIKNNFYCNEFVIKDELGIKLSNEEYDFLSNHFDVQAMEEQYLQEGDSSLDFFNVLVIEEA